MTYNDLNYSTMSAKHTAPDDDSYGYNEAKADAYGIMFDNIMSHMAAEIAGNAYMEPLDDDTLQDIRARLEQYIKGCEQ